MLEEIKTKMGAELTDKEKNKVLGADGCQIMCNCGICGTKLKNVQQEINSTTTAVP